MNSSFDKCKEIPVKDKNVNLITKDSDTTNRRTEHFETVLMKPILPAEYGPATERDLDIEEGDITKRQIHMKKDRK